MSSPKSDNDAEVEVFVNGKRVPINPFVQRVIGNSVLGMVSSLKKVGEIGVVELRISKRPSAEKI